MAWIDNIRLVSVGRVSGTTESARISVTIAWTRREVSENFWYRLSTYLTERNNALDVYTTYPDGGLIWHSKGHEDDHVGRIGSQWVRPSGRSSRTFTFQRNWDFGHLEFGKEEFRGIAVIVPETRGDIRVSNNEISADLG